MNTPAIRPSRPWMFTALAAIILAIVGVGYGPRIFLIGFYNKLEMDHWIIRIHVALVSLWLCTFTLQVLLAATGRLQWHRRVGAWGFRIAFVWVISALLALAVMLHFDPTTGAESFLLITRIGLFSVCLVMAYRQRRNSAEHKRWIILGMSQAIIGGIMRLPAPAIVHDFSRAALIALLFPLALAVYDWATNRRLARATLWGGILILVVHLVRTPISNSAGWLAIANWIGRLGI
jgi:hypothetical protein